MARLYHVSSTRNRQSISSHGLDWTRKSDAHGIAGSRSPELEGCFLCLDPFEVEWFVGMNNTGGPVDVWAADGIEPEQLVTSFNGHSYFPGKIPPEVISLVHAGLPQTSSPRQGWFGAGSGHDLGTTEGPHQKAQRGRKDKPSPATGRRRRRGRP